VKVLKLSISCILFLTLFAGAQVFDIVLQNGDDYTGCEDSYIYSRSSSSNYGGKDVLSMLYEKCSS